MKTILSDSCKVKFFLTSSKKFLNVTTTVICKSLEFSVSSIQMPSVSRLSIFLEIIQKILEKLLSSTKS